VDEGGKAMAEEDKVTPAQIAANILNEAADISSMVVAYMDKKGSFTHWRGGSLITQKGLAGSLILQINRDLIHAENEEEDE